MKKIFFLGITLMVSAAMLLTACKKDKPQPNNGGNDTPTPTEAAANTLVLNGTTYHLDSDYSIDSNGRSYAGAETVEDDAEDNPLFTIIADVELNTLNKTYTFPFPRQVRMSSIGTSMIPIGILKWVPTSKVVP